MIKKEKPLKHWTKMSQDELITEFKHCKEDPKYFISNYIHIIHQLRGEISFDLYPFQGKIIDKLQTNRFNIIRKFRQAGITTLACAYATWIIIFGSNKTIPILSIGDTESTETLERVKLMYDSLPPMFQPEILKRTEHILSLKNGCKVVSRPSKKTSGRSLSGYLLIIDEAAFIEKIDEIWAAVYPIISTGGRAFIISTVNGVGNFYHQMYTEAAEKRNNFNTIDIHWKDHPEYFYNPNYDWLYEELQEKEETYDVTCWESTTKNNVGIKRWLQEYEMEFLGTGDTYIDGDTIKSITETISSDFISKYRNKMRVWKDPEPHYDYILAADVSLGRGRDYSAFHIINLYNGEQVAEFYSNKTPINEFAKIIATEASLYNTAYVMVERNTIGNNLIDWLFTILEYENLWADEKGQTGYQLTAKNRDVILANLEEALRMNSLKINSKRCVDEFNTFIVTETGRAQADKGKNDDLIMSLALIVHGMNTLTEGTPMEHIRATTKEIKPLAPTNQTKYKFKTYGGISEEEIKWLMS